MEAKEERIEYIGIYVTPTLKKELELVKDNQTLRDSIIKNYLQTEKEWLEQELNDIDELTVKYRAKLIGTKEAFSKVQDVHCDEISKMYDKTTETFGKINTVVKNTQDKIKEVSHNLDSMFRSINSIDLSNAERLLELVEKLSKMSKKEKEILSKLLKIDGMES
jgi:ParB-like chromosome segregation protein Spo0J